MDVLKNKETKSYEYTSRYSPFPFYYHTKDDKYIYGITSQIKKDITYTTVKLSQEMTLDYLANKYYGRPDYYWAIADFNDIQDPFENIWEKFDSIKIPTITAIEYED